MGRVTNAGGLVKLNPTQSSYLLSAVKGPLLDCPSTSVELSCNPTFTEHPQMVLFVQVSSTLRAKAEKRPMNSWQVRKSFPWRPELFDGPCLNTFLLYWLNGF